MAKAEVVSMKDLSRSIDKAVAIATKRHEVKADKPNLLVNWEIIGRILRDLQDMNTAFKVAGDITRGVKVRGIQGQPACAKIGRDILVGFIERGRLPRQFGQ